MTIRYQIVLGALIAFAGCASGPREEEVNKSAAKTLAKYERTGEKTTCLSITQISQIRPVTESTFLVKVRAGDYYVNDISGRCNGATRRATRIEYTTSLNQLCSNEIIRIVDNTTGFQVGGCGLGSFEKLKEKSPADEEG